jgi:ribosomal subunit interface protein
MIQHLQISGVHSQLNDDMRQYVEKKIGGLYKYMPKRARTSAHVDVKLKESKSKDKQAHECEVIMRLPKSTLTAHKNSTNILAAIDQVEDNLKNQLKRYKDLHAGPRIHRRLINNFKRQEA